jgi:phosphate transport system substrate-binding protein
MLPALLLLTACAGPGIGLEAAADLPTPTPAPESFRGTITVAGSRILTPLISRAAAEFHKLSPDAFVLVITSTSALGLAALQDNGTDIALSDAKAEDLPGIEAGSLSEYPIGAVPYAVIAHPATDVRNLSHTQLRRIYTGDITNWNQVGGTDLPVVPLHASKGSGLRDLFTNTFVQIDRHDQKTVPIDVPSSLNLPGDVARRAGAISYVPLASVGPDVRVLDIDGVTPSTATIADGRYPFWSYARLYTLHPADGLKQAFINYLRSPNVQSGIVAEMGLVPLSMLKGRTAP